MLYQLLWQYKNGKIEMRAQKDINSESEMAAWEKDIATRHPLPKDAQWLVCNEESKHFVWAAKDDGFDATSMIGTEIEAAD